MLTCWACNVRPAEPVNGLCPVCKAEENRAMMWYDDESKPVSVGTPAEHTLDLRDAARAFLAWLDAGKQLDAASACWCAVEPACPSLGTVCEACRLRAAVAKAAGGSHA